MHISRVCLAVCVLDSQVFYRPPYTQSSFINKPSSNVGRLFEHDPQPHGTIHHNIIHISPHIVHTTRLVSTPFCLHFKSTPSIANEPCTHAHSHAITHTHREIPSKSKSNQLRVNSLHPLLIPIERYLFSTFAVIRIWPWNSFVTCCCFRFVRKPICCRRIVWMDVFSF